MVGETLEHAREKQHDAAHLRDEEPVGGVGLVVRGGLVCGHHGRERVGAFPQRADSSADAPEEAEDWAGFGEHWWRYWVS
eukprot:scaffold87773_cov60-Phaeocystis_antarctica.AAC.4